MAAPRQMGISNQLLKSRKWAEYVLEYSQRNGWEPFQIENRYQDQIRYISMPGSEFDEKKGIYFYKGSYNKRLEAGIQITMRDAMSLALQMKKTHPEMYQEWESTYSQ
jgi:hypothetical protein